MDSRAVYYSPNILIYLEAGEKKVRLSDVLLGSATLYECAEFPPETAASLVFSIDGVEERKEIVLHDGISKGQSIVSFTTNTSPALPVGFYFWAAAANSPTLCDDASA